MTTFIRRRRLIDELAVEYWRASKYSGSGSWLGAKGVADLAFPGGSANPTWLPYSTSQNPFGAGVKYVALPGSASNYVSTPDTAALDITGDISLVAWVALDDWTPSATQLIIAKNGVASQRSYHLGVVATTGVLRFTWSTDGTTPITTDSTAAPTVSDGAALWVAVAVDVDDGGGNRVTKFWTSSNGTSWNQLGTTVTTAGTTSIWSGTAPLEVGSAASGASSQLAGKVARAQVYSGLRDFSGTPSGGTLVADFNPSGGTINSTFSSLTGTGDSLTWTINRATSGRRSAWIGRDWFWFGTDDYLSTADNANFDFGASVDFTIGVLFRAQQNADAAVQTLVSKRDTATSTEGWSAKVEGTTSTTEFSASVESANVVTTVADATWNNPGTLQTHITTRTAGATGTLNIYTDAVDVGGAAAEPGDTGNALVMSAGRVLTSASGANFFEGLIGAIAIFRTGLTAAQVVQLDAELRGLG